ncbi:MAG TPA: hypothetical protein VFW41_07355 [Gaiellaceae bacterium]|jgi:hypothetical protein|nr:hypothetical protein [Gaiellaceae bacterium]
MVKRIVLIGALVAAGMVAIKDGRVLRDAGLTGSCTVAQTLANGEQIEACSSGKLEGAPDLTRNGCTDAGLYTGLVYWRCPAPVVSAP